MKRAINTFCRILLGVVGLVFLWEGAARLQVDWNLHRNSAETEGTVAQIVQTVAYGNQHIVRYQDATGETHQFINRTYYHGRSGPKPGDKVPVRYSLESPEAAAINTLWGRYGTIGEFGLIGLFLCSGALIAPRNRPQ